MNEIFRESRTNNDIDMKFGSLSKREKRNMMILKGFWELLVILFVKLI